MQLNAQHISHTFPPRKDTPARKITIFYAKGEYRHHKKGVRDRKELKQRKEVEDQKQ